MRAFARIIYHRPTERPIHHAELLSLPIRADFAVLVYLAR